MAVFAYEKSYDLIGAVSHYIKDKKVVVPGQQKGMVNRLAFHFHDAVGVVAVAEIVDGQLVFRAHIGKVDSKMVRCGGKAVLVVVGCQHRAACLSALQEALKDAVFYGIKSDIFSLSNGKDLHRYPHYVFF